LTHSTKLGSVCCPQKTVIVISKIQLRAKDADKRLISQGSGFFVRGAIVATNYHVISGSTYGYAKITGDGTSYSIAGIVGIDKAKDLVLLKITGANGKALTLADISTVEVGEIVYALGNPRGLEGTISPGIVSGISLRDVGNENLIQITAPISPGSSGGPVVNKNGEVVGVASSTLKGDGQNLNFAVPSPFLALLLASLKPVSPLGEIAPEISKKENVTDADVCGNTPYPRDSSIGDPWHYIFEGQDLLSRQKYIEAKEAFKLAVIKSPKMPEAYFSLSKGYSNLWRVYKREDCFRKLLISIKQALILKPKELDFRKYLALSLHLNNQFDEAMEVYREGIRILPNEPENYIGLANIYSELKKIAEAKSMLQKAVKLDSKNPSAHLSLGMIYVNEGNKASALEELKILDKIDAEKADFLRRYMDQEFKKK